MISFRAKKLQPVLRLDMPVIVAMHLKISTDDICEWTDPFLSLKILVSIPLLQFK
jgi:hypothetical protein